MNIGKKQHDIYVIFLAEPRSSLDYESGANEMQEYDQKI